MKAQNHRDTRRHPRFNVDVEALVEIQGGPRLAARTRDLSRSGICIITTTRLRAAQPLSVELVLAFGDNAFSEPLRLEAHVVWCTPIAGQYQVGAMFDRLTREHHEFLDMFLHFLDGTLAPTGVAPVDDAEGEGWDEEPTPPPDVKDDPFRR
jgi:hypothetical protein